MDSDTARPGRRGRQARCNRESSRSAGGLRLFSLKVVEKIRSRVRTTYNAVANELVTDQNMSGGSARDGKSIRRRCYDAINVLLACGLIRKDDKKQIVWRGHGNVDLDRLRAEVERKALEVEEKKRLLQDIERKHKTMEALLALGTSRDSEAPDSGCGSGNGGSSSACSGSSQCGGQRFTIPFMLVQAPAGAQVQLHTSDDKTEVQFELADAPPELHDDCSVVMRLQQHQAERQANQACRKSHAVEATQGTDSGQPTPAQEALGTLACDFSSPQTLSQLPPPPPPGTAPPAPPAPSQPQLSVQPCSAHPIQQLQPQRLVDTRHDPQAFQLPGCQPQLHAQPLPPIQQLQERQGVSCQQVTAPVDAPQHASQLRLQSQPHLDFLSHLKPVVTNRTRPWHHQPPGVPPPQPQALPPLGGIHTRPPAPSSWQPMAGAAALSMPPQGPPQSQPQGVFTPRGTLPSFLCARSLEDQLHSPQACPPVGASIGFHQQLGANEPMHQQLGANEPMQLEAALEGHLGQDMHQLHMSLHHPPMQLHQHHELQPHPQLHHPQPEQVFEQMPGAPTSLYTFEQMAEEHLPAHLLPFGADDPDPLGLGPGAASLAADQLGYMGWPFTISPDPFSPSAFLVTPSFMKGPCREPSLQVGAVHVGVQQ